MKVMIYCQHVLGIGHFFRAMEIARALSSHQVLFIEGGEALSRYEPPSHVQRLQLPPIMMDADFKALETTSGNLDEIKAARKNLLLAAIRDFQPDAFVTELFPFGRRPFRFELLPALELLKDQQPKVAIVCSLRDILVEKTDVAKYERWVLEVLNGYYHMLLVHSDPRLIGLNETFGRVDDIRILIHYTGFISRHHAGMLTEGVTTSPPQASRKAQPERTGASFFDGQLQRIVVSSGGGKVGTDLMRATIAAVQLLPRENLIMDGFVGPFTEKAEELDLRCLAARDPRTRLLPFSDDFPAVLSGAALSVSMAGYNTCMDIVATGVRALVYPFPQNREQAMRTDKLAALGLVRRLRSLDPRDLAKTILDALRDPWPPLPDEPINLSGAITTARLITLLGEDG
jgi:predicted glycosyltransferase